MTQAEDSVRDLPPSGKLVLKVLEYNGGLTQKEIVEKSRLSQRTVRDALDRLQEQNIVEKNIYVPDARQNLYTLTVESDAPVEAEASLD
ncbi:MAG: MarR family transcriptional regulator [archaeon]